MSCGPGCFGNSESSRIPSFIPSDQIPHQRPTRPCTRPDRLRTQDEQTGIGPAMPNWRPPPLGSPPHSPRSPLAASSPVYQISPERRPMATSLQRQGDGGGPNESSLIEQRYPRFVTSPHRTPCPVGVAVPVVCPPAIDETYRIPGRMPFQQRATGESFALTPGLDQTQRIPCGENLCIEININQTQDLPKVTISVVPLGNNTDDSDDSWSAIEDESFPHLSPQHANSTDLNDYFPNISSEEQLDDISSNLSYDSGEYLDNVSPPECSGFVSSDSLEDCLTYSEEILEDDAATQGLQDFDLDSTRTRIWQSFMSSLGEIDNAEEIEYAHFVRGIQQQRSELIESSKILA